MSKAPFYTKCSMVDLLLGARQAGNPLTRYACLADLFSPFNKLLHDLLVRLCADGIHTKKKEPPGIKCFTASISLRVLLILSFRLDRPDLTIQDTFLRFSGNCHILLKLKFSDSINRNGIYIICNSPMGIAFRK